jgi:glycosyltransferase involved in cell wall biosynthesis
MVMHIVVVDTTLTTPPTGGAQTFLVDLAESLARRQNRLSVITQPGPEPATLSALRKVGAEAHTQLWSPAHLPEEKATRLADWVNRNDADVYIVSISPDVGWLALPLLDPSIATVSIAHNDVWAFYEPLKHYHPFLDCAVGVSETIRRKIIEECGIPVERAKSIAYGVHAITEDEVELPGAGDRPLRIGYVGRLVQEQKRVMEFVPLAAELVRRGVDFELDLIGDGNGRAALAAELSRNGLQDRVQLSGWLPPAEVAKRLIEMDVFVLLSDYEGLPVALLEAMAHAVAPVVTIIDSGNLELVKDEQNGFTIPVGDINGFADRLEQLARDRDTLTSLKRAAWQTSLMYSVERMTDRYLFSFAEAKARTASRTYRSNLPSPYPAMPSCRSKYPLWLRKLKSRLLEPRSVADSATKSVSWI